MTDIDAVWFKALAERYLDEAAACDQMARATDLSKEEMAAACRGMDEAGDRGRRQVTTAQLMRAALVLSMISRLT